MDEEELHRLKAFLDRSRYRREALKILYNSDNGFTPTQLAKKIEAQRPNISQALIDMKEEGLVKVLNPQDHRDRYYTTTDKGEKLFDRFKEQFC